MMNCAEMCRLSLFFFRVRVFVVFLRGMFPFVVADSWYMTDLCAQIEV